MMTGLLLVGGCALLWAGGEALVAGSVAVARRLGLSVVVIGVMLLGFGTSTPELVTSVNAALLGSTDIAIGNVLGSNTANVLLILGLAALVTPVPLNRDALGPDTWLMLVASMFLGACLIWGPMDRIDGTFFLLMLAVYVLIAFLVGEAKGDPGQGRPVWQGLGLALPGLVAVLVGAHFFVEGAVRFAQAAGLSEALIGATVVAVGTSLPELTASLIAARRGHAELAVGNILGSNIFNIFGVLGASAFAAPLLLSAEALWRDLPITLVATLILAALIFFTQRISRAIGAVLLALYAGYLLLML